jgi:hypothetical protein
MRDANAPLLSTGALGDSTLVDSSADMTAEERGRMNAERMWRAFFGSGERMIRAFCAQAG